MSICVAVAACHPRATDAALSALRRGGSAVDAAIAADAVMGVAEPISTGLGGDVMAVVARGDEVAAHNGTGRAPKGAHVTAPGESDHGYVPNRGGQAVTVPGGVAAWWELHQRFGVLEWDDLMRPAVEAAEVGVALGTVTASLWAAMQCRLDETGQALYCRGGRPPRAGTTWRNPELAETLRGIGRHGPDHLYHGPVAEELSDAVVAAGGTLTTDDLALHHGDWVDPLCDTVGGLELVTLPPTCQGVVALLAAAQLDETEHLGAALSADVIVAQVEAVDRAFNLALDVVADGLPRPELDILRSEVRRRTTFGPLPLSPGTVFTAVARGDELVALVSSVCDRFGSGVTVPGRGFVLQSRARGFLVDQSHPNGVAGGRRPYHTIVPTVGLRDGHPALVLGVVGGIMQPQGQVQVLSRLAGGEPVQAAVDAPRFRLLGDGHVALEDGLPDDAAAALAAAGYSPRGSEQVDFGGGQAIFRDVRGNLSAGTDRRKDGAAATLTLG
jgi:gamma-glutamyltranspeptidase/glutathione hydrolase